MNLLEDKFGNNKTVVLQGYEDNLKLLALEC